MFIASGNRRNLSLLESRFCRNQFAASFELISKASLIYISKRVIPGTSISFFGPVSTSIAAYAFSRLLINSWLPETPGRDRHGEQKQGQRVVIILLVVALLQLLIYPPLCNF